jgi:hypothetical protein
MIVMESGPLGGEANGWEDWHGPFLRNCQSLGVKVICYNNWREPPTDRIFHNSAFDRMPKSIAVAWGRAMRAPTYLHASPELYDRIGFTVGRGDEINRRNTGFSKNEIDSRKAIFNGKDLSGWTSFLKNGDAQADDEFSINSSGVLALRGRHEGYLKTEKSFQDFVLSFDWRFPQGGKLTGSGSGVLLGLGDDDGWLSQGFEVQIASRNCGDLWIYDGFRFDGQRTEGRFGRVHKRLGNEKPIGEWNAYEIRCEGRKAVVKLNGKIVNEATSDRTITGRIGLISQGTEVEFRDVRLTHIEK